MAAVAPVVPTVGIRILLGWMTRDQAVKYLTEECVQPQLSAQEAEDRWNQYRQAVAALPERDANQPPRSAKTLGEDRAVKEFGRRFPNVRRKGVIKIADVGDCVIHQPMVMEERVADYRGKITDNRSKLDLSLPPPPAPFNMQLQGTPQDIRMGVPHGEFVFGQHPGGGLAISEAPSFITVSDYGNRLLLWAGYHRSLAVIRAANEDGIDRSLMVVLTNNADSVVSPNAPNQEVRDMLLGRRPPLLRDFLDDALAMSIRARKKRYEVRCQIVPVNE